MPDLIAALNETLDHAAATAEEMAESLGVPMAALAAVVTERMSGPIDMQIAELVHRLPDDDPEAFLRGLYNVARRIGRASYCAGVQHGWDARSRAQD